MRLTKTNSGVTTRYTYDNGGRIILKEDGAQSTTYIWGGNRLLAKKLASGAQYYYLYNGHGDVVQITDSAGNIVNSYEYDEWGNITSQTEGIENEFKYAGQTYDSETGLYYLRARYYDPTSGRFISKDSNEGSIVNPVSLNLYTYCVNNPIIYKEANGHWIDHVIPLEWAHVMGKGFDPNMLDNLAGIDPTVHKSVNRMWNEFRNDWKVRGQTPTANDVMEFVKKVNKEYEKDFIR